MDISLLKSPFYGLDDQGHLQKINKDADGNPLIEESPEVLIASALPLGELEKLFPEVGAEVSVSMRIMPPVPLEKVLGLKEEYLLFGNNKLRTNLSKVSFESVFSFGHQKYVLLSAGQALLFLKINAYNEQLFEGNVRLAVVNNIGFIDIDLPLNKIARGHVEQRFPNKEISVGFGLSPKIYNKINAKSVLVDDLFGKGVSLLSHDRSYYRGERISPISLGIQYAREMQEKGIDPDKFTIIDYVEKLFDPIKESCFEPELVDQIILGILIFKFGALTPELLYDLFDKILLKVLKLIFQ